jgi:thiamine-monophosphate kinase
METEFIRWLRERLPEHPRLALGVGDDGAILRWGQEAGCVLTVDLLTDQVDFELKAVAPARIGRKALAVNLSDLAAMAARPLAAVVALALPRDGALELAQQLYEGLIPLANRYDLAIAGGDTNCWDGPLVISVALVGETMPSGPLLRAGARPGDSVVVTGRFGGSILGHHFDFSPRVGESLWLAGHYRLSAGIDCSDGLSKDVARLAEASGCGVELEAAKIPVAEAAFDLAMLRNDGSTALDHALGDGEDFELILAVPPETTKELVANQELECGLSAIGRFVAEPGLWLVDADGARRAIEPRGYEH